MSEIPEGLIIIGSDYRVLDAGTLISQLTGLRGEELHNKFCYQILQQREGPCEETVNCCPLREVMKSSKPLQFFRSYLNAQKEEVPFAIDCYPLRSENGDVVQIIGFLRNLDELNKKKSELERIHRFAAMGELFHGIGHNLNTPLSAVMARGEMLAERLKRMGEDHREMTQEGEGSLESAWGKNVRDAEVVVANAMKLSGIIRNMMQKGIQEGEETPQMLNLSYLLKEELKFLESDMKFKHEIEKKYFLDESLPYIKGVCFHFSQGLVNIIRNAMESTDQSEVKEITVTSRYDENNIYIEIHDTGLGAVKKTDQPIAPGEVRLAQTCELLKPYNAELEIRSKSNDNLYTIRIPYKNTEKPAE